MWQWRYKLYSYEIEELLELRDYLLTIKEYVNIIQTSPQIDHVQYKKDHFELFTNDGYKFNFKIKKYRKS